MRKKSILILAAVILFLNAGHAQQYDISSKSLTALNGSHDAATREWGPYSKQYAGISHIPEMDKGLRFDFFVAPGYYRNKVMVPNVLFESGYFPWYADVKSGTYAYRYELEWKDQVYTDVAYRTIDQNTVLATIKCVNRTKIPQNLVLNLMGSMQYPEIWPEQKLDLPADAVWINAVDYQKIQFALSSPKDNLVTDALMNGELRNAGFIDGSALGKRFLQDPGNEVSYLIPAGFKNGYITLVYRGAKNTKSTLHIQGNPKQSIVLEGTGQLSTYRLPYALKGNPILTLNTTGGSAIELNGIVLSRQAVSAIAFIKNPRAFTPQVSTNVGKRQVVLKYPDARGYYGMRWDNSVFKIREIKNDELDVYFRKMVHNHVDSILQGNDKGHYENIFVRPVKVAPESESTFHCLITHGSDSSMVGSTLDRFEQIKAAKPDTLPEGVYLSSGKDYAFSQKMLRASLLENIVYPIYAQRRYIRHYTPGKWWNSLYTWDSGFIALGLNETDIQTALMCINAYTTAPGSQSAFIHHGSPVPVQAYALLDLLNKTQSKAAAQYFYPRLKQYYEFLCGDMGSSTTRTMQSKLLKTWDYFYNSGGWDDYPAQSAVHQQKLESSVTPVITTAQCIRFAKILRMIAISTGNRSDLTKYDRDISMFTQALQKFSWNPKSGYFSYVQHDSNGMPKGPFTTTDAIDYNMGMDGAYPLIAGVCTEAQQKILIEKIFSPEHMWTPSGMGVVDQDAPYYRRDGYWNGSVWMPHQWFVWKTMLDLGKSELAMKVAKTGLDVFSREANNSYHTFEHFLAENGRGAGWHQFSGLSTPVLTWYNACYKQGSVTTGFEILLEESHFDNKFTTYQGTLSFDESTAAHSRSMMVCLDPSKSYQAVFNGKAVTVTEPYAGLVCVTLPATNKGGVLIIKQK
jgi:hypothetical protein